MADIQPGGSTRFSPDAELQRLLSRLRSRYATRNQQVVVGSREYSFTRVVDPDQILQAYELAASNDSDTMPWEPYWAQAWESGVFLAEVLASRDLAGQSVLDLGCGLGLVGAVAASFDARVTMVDAAPPALLFARVNCWPWRNNATVRRLDWRRDELREKFSLIAGSDIIYDREEWPHLDRFWRRHLQDGGSVLLAEPGRSTGDEFAAWIESRDWQVEGLEREPSAGIRVTEIKPSA